MIHDLDIVLNLVGSRAHRISAVGAAVSSEVEDVANVQLWFANGCLATITASRATQEKIRTLASRSAKNMCCSITPIRISASTDRAPPSIASAWRVALQARSFDRAHFVHKDNPLKLEIKHLLDCATIKRSGWCSAEDELLLPAG